MEAIKSTHISDEFLDNLLGIDSSKIGYYAEVKQKIQELEAANLGLKTKKTELQAVFDSISDGVLIYDSSGLVQHRNHVIPKLFPTETLIGKSCKALFHPESKTDLDGCPVGKALRGDSFQMSFSQARSGKNLFYDIAATPIQDPGGFNRALIFVRDITERRTKELQLLQAEKMSSIGVLAAGVAHEINNPMTSVAGYAEALLRRFRDSPELHEDPRLEDFANYLSIIVREVYRCKDIIESLLSFSRKSDGSMGRLDLNRIIGEVLELVRHQTRDKKIELKQHLQTSLPDIEGDASALRQVFLNLVLNAIQAIDKNGAVIVTTASNETHIVARVRDNGTGIAPDMLDQIWNPFFTTKVVGKNQGLGLAMTYDIVEKHKGSISVKSKLGEGTEFIVRIPKCHKR
ncbi:MAG: PAS domain S-box protein [Deltaproteobacteria bacterium]|jgi:PAS domain S-box-containing protein|nr:PAS domain S-box protein [Deltaproteobacteria bacterium]MBW2518899.1 PAS domain S-box protein [Deltaproteobacteria bacterium]